MKKQCLFIFLSILCVIPALLPLFHPGFFQTDDGEWMIIRFSAFHQALVAGQFPVRFLDRLNFGYGYPVADFLYPGFMYLGEILKLLRFGFVDVIKITLGISLTLSMAFTFFWLSKLFKRIPAFIGALVYLYVSYHLFDAYKRGSVGEVLALATIPFILWQIERKSFFWISLGVALLILSHNTLAILFVPIILFYSFFRTTIRFTLIAILFGLGLSGFFWIPALYDLQYTVFSKTQVSNWHQYFAGISLIGFSTLFLFVLAFVTLFVKRPGRQLQLPMYFFVVGIISIFFATSGSAIFWQVLPVSFVQFPFRFLSLTILCSAFLSAFIISQLPHKIYIVFAIVLTVLLFFDAKPYLTSTIIFNKGDMYYVTNQATTTVQDEYMPVWVKEKPQGHFVSKVLMLKGQAVISDIFTTAKQTVFSVNAQEKVLISVSTVYFPGWVAFIDGKQTDITYNNAGGVIQVAVPAGLHVVRVAFQETQVRLISDVISLAAGITLMIFFIKERKRFFLL